jgi:hypothetical protein
MSDEIIVDKFTYLGPTAIDPRDAEIERLRELDKVSAKVHNSNLVEMREMREVIERLKTMLDLEQTANRITENHNHFDWAAAMARKDAEIAALKSQRLLLAKLASDDVLYVSYDVVTARKLRDEVLEGE